MNEQVAKADVLVLDTAETNSLGKEVSLVEKQADSVVIASDADFQDASEFTRSVKSLQKKVKDYWEPMRVSTKKAYDDVIAHKKEMLDPLDKAEKILKDKMATYTIEMQRKQREQEEKMKRLAQEEADRKLAEAIAAQDSGDLEAAASAMAEAEVMDDMAFSGISVASQKPKADGISTSKSWKITAINEDDVPIDINGAVIRPVDTSAIMALIKATKGKIKIPGVTYEETVTVSVRAN